MSADYPLQHPKCGCKLRASFTVRIYTHGVIFAAVVTAVGLVSAGVLIGAHYV